MSDRYRVQELDGYTDGRPSWVSVIKAAPSKASAEEIAERLRALNPKRTYRVRKRANRGHP